MPGPRTRPLVTTAGLGLALLLVCAAVIVLARPGGGADAGAAESTGAKRFADDSCQSSAVRFGVVLPDGDAQGRAAADRLTTDLAEGLGCRAIAIPYATQARLVTALAMQEVDIAQLDPAAAIVASRATGSVPAGAYAVDEDTPARTAPTEMWVRRSTDLRTLQDLRGRRIALGPALTAGGDLDPRSALLRAGVRPDATETTTTSGDDEALTALRRGRVDAAVTRGAPIASETEGLRRIWSATGPLADVVLLRPAIPRAVRRLIQVAIRDLPGAALAPLAARQGISEPAPLAVVPLDLYAPVASRLDDLIAAGLTP
ncbi:phosphate/phosphite/phosphonate ABC transporter substrate-binding protein [Patulibacter sp.]|uniref:phosphate/phosphite/phosphonate ABC transporter substrate-binding protein n=1 Tax=Patulibacter sp. TaxID=1912859 RepID=UPI0027160DDD|nr:PhnD/SsuA/transferrin family substrate-binding protein [Patulibacter sp.]MDO9409198.1 PhnD/SsuA/transferrin family substrate-binding protein [Patulibacter sp.]